MGTGSLMELTFSGYYNKTGFCHFWLLDKDSSSYTNRLQIPVGEVSFLCKVSELIFRKIHGSIVMSVSEIAAFADLHAKTKTSKHSVP